jgi:hypothetical protein
MRWLLAALLCACGSSSDPVADAGPTVAPDAPAVRSDAPGADAGDPCAGAIITQSSPEGVCAAVTVSARSEGADHVTSIEGIVRCTDPPASGSHLGQWGSWSTHPSPLPRGNYLHNLEHGGVALLYNCDPACPDVVRQLEAIAEAFPVDPLCQAVGLRNRILITADPDLGSRVGAAAWTHAYRADCVDKAHLRAFVDQHYGMGPEALCGQGSVP